MVYKKRHIIAILANVIFVGGTVTSFISHNHLPEYFLYYVNFGCIYLFSLTGLLLSKRNLVRSLSIPSCGFSAAKIFYAAYLVNLPDVVSVRMLFIIFSVLFMILHLVVWLAYDFKKWTS